MNELIRFEKRLWEIIQLDINIYFQVRYLTISELAELIKDCFSEEIIEQFYKFKL